MANPIKVALVVALVLEVVNVFGLGMQPLKGYTAGHPTRFEHIRDIEQTILHYPAVFVANKIAHWIGDAFPRLVSLVAILVLFLGGYFETALLIIGGIFAFRVFGQLLKACASRTASTPTPTINRKGPS
jgi:hypothetical protein